MQTGAYRLHLNLSGIKLITQSLRRGTPRKVFWAFTGRVSRRQEKCSETLERNRVRPGSTQGIMADISAPRQSCRSGQLRIHPSNTPQGLPCREGLHKNGFKQTESCCYLALETIGLCGAELGGSTTRIQTCMEKSQCPG